MSATLNLNIALLSSAVLGLRHGFDYDHIAAISDITSVQDDPKRAMRLGLLYALGHGATVAALGGAAISFQMSLPKSIDHWAERVVGFTLLILGACVLINMMQRENELVPRSRISLLLSGFHWSAWKIRNFFRTAGPQPRAVRWNYDGKSVFAVGMIHGLGAETPSQLMLFFLAANLGGLKKGFLGLIMFLAGLLIMNSLMTLSATGMFGFSDSRPRMLRFATGLTAAYSFVVGLIFLLGASTILPPLGA